MSQSLSGNPAGTSLSSRLLILSFESIPLLAYQQIVERICSKCPSASLIHFPRGDQSHCETSPNIRVLEMPDIYDPLWPVMPESWYERLRPIEGHTLRMMDRMNEKIGLHTGRRGSFDYRRELFLSICAHWFQILNECNPSHFLCIDVPHQPFDYVGYHAAKTRGARTAIMLHEKSGDAHRSQLLSPIGSKRLASSLDQTSYRFVCDGHDPMQILDERVPDWISQSPYRASLESVVGTSDVAFRSSPSVVRRDRRARELFNLYRNRLHRPPALHVRALRARLLLRRWRKRFEHNGVTPSTGERFAVFYLAYQPEASTSPRAGLYVEQNAAIGLAVQALRGKLKVYVREHPDQFNRRRPRTTSLTSFLVNTSEVYLLAPSITSEWCLANASLILSAPGSIVRQAWRAGVPVVQFGRSELSDRPGVLDEAFLFNLASGSTELPLRRKDPGKWREIATQHESELAASRLIGGPLTGHRTDKGLSDLASSLSWVVTEWITRQQ
jgi:hypothetical protein